MFQNIFGQMCLNCNIFDKQNAFRDIGRKESNRNPLSLYAFGPSSPKCIWVHLLCICPESLKHQWDKLDPKAVKCIFVGYSSNQNGYKCYALGKKGRMFVTIDVTFHEDVPFYSSASE